MLAEDITIDIFRYLDRKTLGTTARQVNRRFSQIVLHYFAKKPYLTLHGITVRFDPTTVELLKVDGQRMTSSTVPLCVPYVHYEQRPLYLRVKRINFICSEKSPTVEEDTIRQLRWLWMCVPDAPDVHIFSNLFFRWNQTSWEKKIMEDLIRKNIYFF